jgi:spore maturation protein CgeB
MRVAIVGSGNEGSLARGLVRGASAAGCQADLVAAEALVSGTRPLILARRRGKEQVIVRPFFARLRRQLAKIEPDLILVVKGRFITADRVALLRGLLDVPVINYYPDHPLWPGFGERQIVEALHAYDEVVVWSDVLADPLRLEGIKRVRVVPFAYDPYVYRTPPEPVRHTWDTVLLGQCYPERVPYPEIFADRRILVSGSGWVNAARGGPLDGRVNGSTLDAKKTCATYWQSATALNVLSVANLPAHNMRTFEIPASGTLMIANRTPEHVDLLGEDGAVLVDSPDEARDRVLQLLKEPELLHQVAGLGRARVLPHTYASRLKEIIRPWAASTVSARGEYLSEEEPNGSRV